MSSPWASKKIDGVLQLGEVLIGCPKCRQLGDARLERFARLEHAENVVGLQSRRRQWPLDEFVWNPDRDDFGVALPSGRRRRIPASASRAIAPLTVGRDTSICAARTRSPGSTSPSFSSPERRRSTIWPTTSLATLRVRTGLKSRIRSLLRVRCTQMIIPGTANGEFLQRSPLYASPVTTASGLGTR